MTADAKLEMETNLLISGEVHEVWQMNLCGNQLRYKFRIAPGKGGEALRIAGFERLR